VPAGSVLLAHTASSIHTTCPHGLTKGGPALIWQVTDMNLMSDTALLLVIDVSALICLPCCAHMTDHPVTLVVIT
jgi:hypothetical protein